MESVFSAAYCTIAATAAVNSNSGFLERDISPKYVYVQDALGKQFYISTDIDDFDNDVGKPQPNTRAWVRQEGVERDGSSTLVLSRHTGNVANGSTART
jgi:hypothetical protein